MNAADTEGGARSGTVFKRFMIGLVLGIGLMYWYIHNGEDLLASMDSWMSGSAAKYRGDSTHRAIERQTR